MNRFLWRCIGCLAILFVSAAQPSHSASVLKLLCVDKVKVLIDAGEYIVPSRAEIDGNRLTMHVRLWVSPGSLKRVPHFNLGAASGVGYELDGTPAVGVKLLTHAVSAEMAISFFGLAKGSHRLMIGLIDTSGKLRQENAFCFSTPQHLVLGPM